MAAGCILLLCAGILLVYNRWDDRRAGAESDYAVTSLVDEIQSRQADIVEIEADSAPAPDSKGLTQEQVQAIELDDTYYSGVLTIPKLDRILPVQSDWSMTKLKHSPCRYSGSLENGQLVIAAHNYTRHFGGLHRLSVGDSVYFTDLEGSQYRYEVEEVYTTEASDIQGMVESGYDLTLFTCNYGGEARITVRCNIAGTDLAA